MVCGPKGTTASCGAPPWAGPGPLTPSLGEAPGCPRCSRSWLEGSLHQTPMEQGGGGWPVPPLSELTEAAQGLSLPSTRGGGPLRAPTQPSPQGGSEAEPRAEQEQRCRPRTETSPAPAPDAPGATRLHADARAPWPRPEAYLVVSHGVQAGQVWRQHQVLLDPLIAFHKDGAILHGAAVRGQVHLRARGQVREGAWGGAGVRTPTAPAGRGPSSPSPAPGLTLRTWPSEVPRKAMVWLFSVVTVTAVKFRPPRCSTALAVSPSRLPSG